MLIVIFLEIGRICFKKSLFLLLINLYVAMIIIYLLIVWNSYSNSFLQVKATRLLQSVLDRQKLKNTKARSVIEL